MPYERWFKLSDEKKDRIVQASIHEFAARAFEEASINQIIKKADISRGSFYTYFEDKEDLYRYITSDLVDTMIGLADEILNQKGKDVFETLKSFYDIFAQHQYIASDAADVLHMILYKSLPQGPELIHHSRDKLSKIFYASIQREYDIPEHIWDCIYYIIYSLMYQTVREQTSDQEIQKSQRERLFASLDYLKNSLLPYQK